MYLSNISNEEIKELDLLEFEGPIEMVEDIDHQIDVCKHLINEKVLGFDTESKPAFKKGQYFPVALIQLATERRVYLFRVNKSGVSNEMTDLFESKKIQKVGVAIRDDVKDLQKIKKFNAAAFLSLEKEVKKVEIESNGLRKLAAIIMEGRISKSAQVSNWEAEQLTEKQKIYAATDAWVSIAMLRKLANDNPSLFPYFG